MPAGLTESVWVLPASVNLWDGRRLPFQRGFLLGEWAWHKADQGRAVQLYEQGAYQFGHFDAVYGNETCVPTYDSFLIASSYCIAVSNHVQFFLKPSLANTIH